MIAITGLSHISVNVDDIDAALAYYQSLLGAEPLQIFPNFRNEGFARSAGFGDSWDQTDVSIAFMELPSNALTLELMQYHSPEGQVLDHDLSPTDRRRVAHIALKVTGIDAAFAHVRAQPGTRMISNAPDYRPERISPMTPSDFRFFDPAAEADAAQKQATAEIVSNIRFFYFVDRYGIQWECEEGHHDIGDPTG
ncbi:VOC family protein [Ruegeria hyattellae]|uniref:VOC family protein n=1 Tax=Ruegeria hyattellae TaxID=3233337 RepID=UPI00355C938E